MTACQMAIAYTVSCLLCMAAGAAESTDRVSVKLEPVRWQLLPAAIQSVCIGPDGRTWFTLVADDSRPSAAEQRATLEKEYGDPVPQLRGVSLALLEPSGRAWFYVKPDELWGYDGQHWVERKTAPGSNFTGECPTRGQVPNNLANRFAGGRVFFRDEQGIHIYDGQQWTYAALCPPINSEHHLPRLAVSPNGKFALAMTPRLPGKTIDLKNPALWLWQADEPAWHKLAVDWGDKNSVFASSCISDEGKLWCTQGGRLRIIDIVALRDVFARFTELIRQLDDRDNSVRRRATQALDAVAELMVPRLRLALSSAGSAAAKEQLTKVIDGATRGGKAPIVARQPLMIGSYTVQAVGDVFGTEEGKTLLFAMVSKPMKQGLTGGLLTVDLAGCAELVPIGPLTNIPSPSNLISVGRGRGPIMSPAGDVMWISGASAFGPGVRQVNLNTAEVVKQDSDTNYGGLMAVDLDGRAFVSASNRSMRAPVPFGVFSPGVSDPRPMLQASVHPIRSPQIVVATEGRIWAMRSEGLSRFDGRDWTVIQATDRGAVYPILTGRDGVLLCRTSSVQLPSEYALFQHDKLVAIAPLRKLVAAHAETLITGFPPDYTPIQRNYRVWIATDNRRNVWMLEDYQRLAVFTGEKWVETPEGADAPLALRTGTGSRVAIAVGGGSKVYFSTALAELKDDRMLCTEAPGCFIDLQMPIGLRDLDGAFWLPSIARQTAQSPQPPGISQYAAGPGGRKHRAVRISESGSMPELPMDAWPFLIDETGNVWLAEMGPSRPRSHFWIWRNGQIVQELKIPGADNMCAIFSDKRGSVFVGTSLGLHHLVAEDLEQAREFRLTRTFFLPESLPNQFSCPYSKLAGLVVTASNSLTLISPPID